MYREEFTTRQVMNDQFYEYHHYRDELPLQVDFHQHDFYEIYIFISGNVNYIIEGRTYCLKPGDILITNCSDIHRPEILPSEQPYERAVIWLDEAFFDRIRTVGEDLTHCFMDAAVRDYRLVRPNRHQLSEIAACCRRIEDELGSDRIGHLTMAYSAIMELLVLISRAYYDNPGITDYEIFESEQINNVILYINDHLEDRLSVAGIASRFYISSSFLSHQFRKYVGLPIYKYIIKKRLIKAHNLLTRNIPVTTAFSECGFSDYSNFLKAFKREYGYNPGFLAGRKSQACT